MEAVSSYTYIPLPDSEHHRQPPQPRLRPSTTLISTTILSLLLFSSSIVFVYFRQGDYQDSGNPDNGLPKTWLYKRVSRGVSQGVSEKSNIGLSSSGEDDNIYPWTNAMLTWQRTGFHFQPPKNWMNDPNGPLYHLGWYHLFYQYNPDSAVWGSVTILPDGRIFMWYTGDTNEGVQVQNLAYPANLSDPLLLEWVKYPGNPVIVPPPGILDTDFRDPTTAWVGSDGKWRLAIGSKVNKTGVSLVYETTNFTSFELLDGVMHAVPSTGMWECIDFYPIPASDSNGLDTSINGPDIKHVLKASLDDDKHDYYALGTYDPSSNNIRKGDFYGVGLGRMIAKNADILKGWSSVMTIPRNVVFDKKTGTNILQWPVKEVEKLRSNGNVYENTLLEPGSLVPLDAGLATQLDIVATFDIDDAALKAIDEVDTGYNCKTSGGSYDRGVLGPFGLLVLADQSLVEKTAIYFYIAKGGDGVAKTHFCADESRSSTAMDVTKSIYGSTIQVLDDENYTMRLLVDHSIVESFGQGGRSAITSRVYPTKAIYGAAKVFLFNNATGINVTANVNMWNMDSAYLDTFLLAQQ
nr:beta-fructofuranosidase, soluble isoenzyme I-like [Tanacetum cinerariifolium]